MKLCFQWFQAALAGMALLTTNLAEAADTTATTERVILVGDSTVASQSGWGDAFAKWFAPGVECQNLGRGGRSSKSYRAEGHWKKVLEAKPGWVLIQFGHNDQPGKGPERETDAKTTFRENLTRYVYAALGPEQSKKAFVHYPANTFPGRDTRMSDDPHHNAFGGYELARCMVEGIKAAKLDLVRFLALDVKPFDPAHPDRPEDFSVPASPLTKTEKPAGN